MMPSVDSHVDAAARTAVITTSFDRPADVVWTLFSDPQRLARWWGPPGMPMTVDRHELRPGGSVELTVSTGGGDIRGRWTILEVHPPRSLTFTFSSDGLDPTEIAVELAAAADGATTMTITARFATETAMRHAVDIGFVEGVARSCASAHEAVAGRPCG